MEKKNIMTREEFKHFETIDAMYDMYLSVVTGFNRLVDICNDSSERIAELVIERDNLSKGVQKLIGEKDDLIEKHNVYTSALNADIAAKAAKIELMQKELDGRKAGYVALKTQMDTKYISIDEHNDICKAYEKRVDELEKEIEKLNKCIMNKNESINTGNEAIINLRKEIGAHEEENKRLSEKIMKLHNTITELAHDIDNYKSWNASLHKDIKELKAERDKHMARVNDLRKDIDSWKHDVYEELKKNEELEEKIKKLTKELEEMTKSRDTWFETAGAHGETIRRDSEEIKKLNEEVEKRFKYIISQSETICNLKKELAKKNDEIKKLKEDNLQLSVGRVDTDFVNKLIQENDYYKDQERIRTDQLRATERKVDELHKQIERLKKESKNKNDIIRKAYTRYIDEACKDREEIMDECYKKIKNDGNGYIGFKQYTLRALEEKKDNEKEAKEFLCNEVSLIFYNKKAEERRKEEETEVKGNGRTSSGRYPWGAKVNDIPCGEDSIE